MIAFPDPVISDPELVEQLPSPTRSRSRHPATRLERDQRLAEWLHAADPSAPRRSAHHDDPAATATTKRYTPPATTSPSSPSATSASTNSPTPPESANFDSSAYSANELGYHPTPSKSPTASAPPDGCSKPEARSPTRPPPPASLTKATSTATYDAALASPQPNTKDASTLEPVRPQAHTAFAPERTLPAGPLRLHPWPDDAVVNGSMGHRTADHAGERPGPWPAAPRAPMPPPPQRHAPRVIGEVSIMCITPYSIGGIESGPSLPAHC